MYQEIKKNSFRYIFTLMDSDEDGLISALKINILGLDTEVLQLLAPLLCEMEEVRIELDEEEFVDSLERLFSVNLILFRLSASTRRIWFWTFTKIHRGSPELKRSRASTLPSTRGVLRSQGKWGSQAVHFTISAGKGNWVSRRSWPNFGRSKLWLSLRSVLSTLICFTIDSVSWFSKTPNRA